MFSKHVDSLLPANKSRLSKGNFALMKTEVGSIFAVHQQMDFSFGIDHALNGSYAGEFDNGSSGRRRETGYFRNKNPVYG